MNTNVHTHTDLVWSFNVEVDKIQAIIWAVVVVVFVGLIVFARKRKKV